MKTTIESQPEHQSQKWLLEQTIAAFRKRADLWDRGAGDAGKMLASEMRGAMDCFDEILSRPAEREDPPLNPVTDL